MHEHYGSSVNKHALPGDDTTLDERKSALAIEHITIADTACGNANANLSLLRRGDQSLSKDEIADVAGLPKAHRLAHHKTFLIVVVIAADAIVGMSVTV